MHHAFLKQLAAELSAAQVEAIKDEMTYHKVKVTYDAYCEIVPPTDGRGKGARAAIVEGRARTRHGRRQRRGKVGDFQPIQRKD